MNYLSTLHGDGPCDDCGNEPIIWFTDSTFWNAVIRRIPDTTDPFLCITCFVRRAEALGFAPTGWRVLPEWPIRGEPPLPDTPYLR